MAEYSYLDLINQCDNFPPRSNGNVSEYDNEKIIPLFLTSDPASNCVGLLRPVIVELLQNENKRSAELGSPTVNWICEESRVSFADHIRTPSERSAVLAELCARLRDSETFPDQCGRKKWRDELYAIYTSPIGPRSKENLAFEMERSACALFGVVTYGVHMTMYEDLTQDRHVHIWVSKRSKTKQTWPGFVDNTVAGGIPSGMSVFDAIVKECEEEASISENDAASFLHSAGFISYFYRADGGWLQPEVQYIYDLPVPDNGLEEVNIVPKPKDGEVESFQLLSLADTIRLVKSNKFKPNCALVLIDFLIRQGIITADNEPNYHEIVFRLHGNWQYERWATGFK